MGPTRVLSFHIALPHFSRSFLTLLFFFYLFCCSVLPSDYSIQHFLHRFYFSNLFLCLFTFFIYTSIFFLFHLYLHVFLPLLFLPTVSHIAVVHLLFCSHFLFYSIFFFLFPPLSLLSCSFILSFQPIVAYFSFHLIFLLSANPPYLYCFLSFFFLFSPLLH